MKKHLFFLCPTDCLESTIELAFSGEHHFLTSLGNSVTFDANMVEEVNALLEKHAVTEITFVLANTNQLVLDAVKERASADVRGMEKFYQTVGNHSKIAKKRWQNSSGKTATFSHHLNRKVNELKLLVQPWLKDKVTFNAMLYKRSSNSFIAIPSEVYCLQLAQMN